MHEAAAVERRHLVALLGQLGDLDPQHVLEEVVERVGRVGLQPGGRHDDVAVGERGTASKPARLPSKRVNALARARESRCRCRGATRRRRRASSCVVDRAGRARVVEQRAEPVLLLGGRELDPGEAGGERRHRRVPVGVAASARSSGSGRGLASAATALDEEARRHALGGAAEVAAGEQEHALVRRAGQRGEQAPVVVVDPGGAQGERAVGGAPVGVGEQRVVAHAGREEALGQAAHEDPVEVEARARGRRGP